MCGIVGVAGWIGQAEAKMFRTMLLWDTVRGLDSTGVLAVGLPKDEIIVEKDLGGPTNLWDYGGSKIFTSLRVPKTTFKVLLGHNRAATIGDITVDNAHPFTYGKITGVHNGTLRLWADLDPDNKFNIDSKALINGIAEHGIAGAWSKFSGAAAVVCYDSEEETLSFVRNSERPLTFAWSSDRRTLFWASEAWMIRMSAERHGIKLEQFSEKETKKGDAIWQFSENKCSIYKIRSNGVDFVKTVEVKNKEPNFTKSSSTAHSGGGVSYYRPGYVLGGHTKGADFWNNNPKRTIPFAANLAKGPKEVRGSVLRLHSLGEKYLDNMWVPVFRGVCEMDDTYVEVYPVNPLHMKKIDEAVKASNGGALFKLNARPRLAESYLFGTKHDVYRISSGDIKRIVTRQSNVVVLPPKDKMYVGPFGELMPEADLRKAFKDAGGACIACSTPLVIEDAHKYDWINRNYPSCLCEDCKDNSYYRSLIVS